MSTKKERREKKQFGRNARFIRRFWARSSARIESRLFKLFKEGVAPLTGGCEVTKPILWTDGMQFCATVTSGPDCVVVEVEE
jgi:hypothetical protein